VSADAQHSSEKKATNAGQPEDQIKLVAEPRLNNTLIGISDPNQFSNGAGHTNQGNLGMVSFVQIKRLVKPAAGIRYSAHYVDWPSSTGGSNSSVMACWTTV
jgi:hypothetical protein